MCKAWRAFRTQLELWRDIGGLAEGDNRYHSRAWVHGRGMMRLMSWLPTNAAHTLSIAMHNKHDDKAIDAASICAAMKNLRGWKGGLTAKQKDGAGADPSALRSLTLHSTRVGGTVLKTAAALFGSELTHLDVGDYACRKVNMEDVLKSLVKMPKLERLKVYELGSRASIQRIAATLRKARDGVPLLTHLESDCGNMMAFLKSCKSLHISSTAVRGQSLRRKVSNSIEVGAGR